MTTGNSHDAYGCTGGIADLLAWCRRLTDAGPGNVDPAELAAYQQAKGELLARLTGATQITHTPTETRDDRTAAITLPVD